MKSSAIALLLVSILLVTSSNAAAPSSCNTMCKKRCEKAGIYKRCIKYCCICCAKCKCVPSGTYGNKSECPCYRDMLNSKGKPKCP